MKDNSMNVNIDSVRSANILLKKNNINEFKISSRQTDEYRRIYEINQITRNGKAIKIKEEASLYDAVNSIFYNCRGIKPLTPVEKVEHVIKDVDSFNKWLQSPDIKNIELDVFNSKMGDWKLEVREYRNFGKIYTVKNVKKNHYWNNTPYYSRCSELNIKSWIHTLCMFAGIEEPQYTGEVIKANTVSNANKFLYLKGVNKGEDWRDTFEIRQQGNKFILVYKDRGNETIRFTGNTPGECLKYALDSMGYGVDNFIYE